MSHHSCGPGCSIKAGVRVVTLLPLLLLPSRVIAAQFSWAGQVVLPSGQTGSALLELRAEKLPASVPSTLLPEISDNGDPVKVKFTVLKEVSPSPPGVRTWSIRADVSGLTGKVTQPRLAEIKIGDILKETKPYILTNQIPAPFSWSPAPPATGPGITWNLAAQRIGLGMVQGPAHEIKIGSCQLIEQTTKVPLACGHLHLCQSEDITNPCSASLEFTAIGPNAVFLELADGPSLAGNYKGTVLITASEKPEGQSFQLDIYSRPSWGIICGILCIVLGVALAWGISFFARTRIDRDQALIPVVLLGARLTKILATLRQVPPLRAPLIADVVTAGQNLQDGLTEQSLDSQGLLPARLPNPYSAPYSPNLLSQYLQKATDSTNALEVIAEAIVKVLALDSGGLPAAQAAAIAVALGQLNALVPAISTGPQAQQQTLAILAQLGTALAPPPPPVMAVKGPLAKPGAAPAKAATPGGLNLQIRHLTWIIWGVLLLTTVLTGLAAVILPKPGFGLARDYLTCFLWGVGLPVAGMQLTALLPSAVTTAFRVPSLR